MPINLMNVQVSKLALAVFLAAAILLGSSEMEAQAQLRPIGSKLVKKRGQKVIPAAAAGAASPARSPAPTQAPPVSVVNLAEPDYLSGEARVTVNPKQPTVIRLGLAQNAVSIVEFPASDGIYYIHEGNPKLASVFHSPTKETDRSITIYPGESFLPSRDGGAASAISLQMRSGLVLILELIPVAELRKNAHRCVVTYDRDAVISARRTAGLAYDLGGEGGSPVPMNSRAVSKLVSGVPQLEPSPVGTQPENGPSISSVYADVPGSKPVRVKGADKRRTEVEISALANKRLAESIKEPLKHLAPWSKPDHGLELAVSRVTELDPETRLVVVGVRNVTTANLRLVPGSPELQVQTSDSGGNGIQTTRIDPQYVESTTLEGLVQAGSIAYYALVYKAPILGINQNIRVLVAHREAADAPITWNIGDRKN
ncbi:MAG: hypothetical protein DCC44_01025 [Acidobacteria bacterium]|jgi:hypothetical protein|nr:MAG: hypothetical protein DCC44_01025 [Acidobacteriota bacterium]